MTPSVRAIRILPPEITRLIAAGEVISRPLDVVRELLDNALDAGASRIDVELERGGLGRITVRDNGVGIPNDLHQRVFEMFFRANETSRGSGLGLYLVEKCVASLNGQMRLQSTEGQGTHLAIQLPNRG